MAESHAVDVGGISEDEDEGLNNEESVTTNEYPDPDFVPSYPWLGERGSLHDNGPMFYEQPTVHKDIDQDYPDDASRQFIAFEGLDLPKEDSLNTYPILHAGRDPHDPSFDPDFQLSDGGAAYVAGCSNDFIASHLTQAQKR